MRFDMQNGTQTTVLGRSRYRIKDARELGTCVDIPEIACEPGVCEVTHTHYALKEFLSGSPVLRPEPLDNLNVVKLRFLHAFARRPNQG